jgi:hypothetical protein
MELLMLEHPPHGQIAAAGRRSGLVTSASHLVEQPRLRSGHLPNDVAVVC